MPHTGAAAVILNPDRTLVLLVKRRDFRIWTIPGGGSDEGEDLEMTAIRETREETGLEVVITSTVGRYWRPQMPGGGDHYAAFRAEVTGGEPITSGPETAALQWKPINALPRAMHRFTREIIRDAASGLTNAPEREQRMPAVEEFLFKLLFWLRDQWNRRRPAP